MRARIIAAAVIAGLASPVSTSAAPRDTHRVALARQILREASQLVDGIDEDQRPSAAANIAWAQARAGDLVGAFATAHSLAKPSDQAMALGSISWVVAHGGNLAWALQIVANAEDGPSKAIALLQIADQRAGVGDFARALAIARMIQGQLGYRIEALVRIGTAQWKSGDPQGAKRTLREALDEVERAQEAGPKREALGVASMFVRIAGAQATLGDHGGALATIDHVYGMATSADDSGSREMLLQELAMGQALIGEVPAGLETAREMLSGSQRDFALEAVAEQQARQGDSRGALETAATIRDPIWGPLSLRRIACAQAASGDVAGALETIDSMGRAVERAEALAEVALDEAESGGAAAEQTLRLAWEAAKNAQSGPPPYVFEQIAVARGILGDMAGALEIVEGMKDPRSKVWPLWNLTAMMVAAGNASGALALAEAQDKPEPKAYALLGVAQGLLKQIDAERKK